MKKQNFAYHFRWASHREILEKGTELGPKKRNIHSKIFFKRLHRLLRHPPRPGAMPLHPVSGREEPELDRRGQEPG